MRFALIALLVALALPLSAQLPSPAELAQLRNNPELVRQRIRQSGLTAEQIRARLTAAGYPATMLDAYLSDAALPEGQVGEDHIGALGILGVADRTPEAVQTLDQQSGVERRPGGGEDAELNLFGADVFRGRTTQFQPLLAGPVPENYRIGPGDVLVLVLTGDVEFVHTLEVTRDGFVLIPQVGQLYLNNLTMDALRTTLRRRLGESYSGVRTGTTQFDVTIARLRTNQVFVIGEVVQPGAYQLSSVATVLNALYAAGGPTDRGNFRQVIVRRLGDTVSVFDLYDYLLEGDTRNDIVLNQGDVIFVPVQGVRAAVRGAVIRPAIYELKPGETLRELVVATGGFRPTAALRRISISRIVPPSQRTAVGPDRITVDVPIEQVVDGTAPPFPIEPGDQVMVFDVPDARRATV
ncbi:MAG: polysaccharide biosynthesis/export family protein, partial [Gemmatimonadales bacterium]